MEEMEDYKLMLRSLAEANSSELIRNSSQEHAAAVIAELFTQGKKTAYVLAQKLSTSVYGRPEVVGAIKVFLTNGGKLKAILMDAVDGASTNAIIRDTDGLMHKLGTVASQVDVLSATEKLTAEVTFNFLIVDEKAFRFEPDSKAREAFASFNRPDIAQKLQRRFDEFMEKDSGLVKNYCELAPA